MPIAKFKLLIHAKKAEELDNKEVKYNLGENLVIASIDGGIAIYAATTELTPEEQEELAKRQVMPTTPQPPQPQ